MNESVPWDQQRLKMFGGKARLLLFQAMENRLLCVIIDDDRDIKSRTKA